MHVKYLKGLKMGASVALSFAAFLAVLANQTIEPMTRPIINAKFLPVIFIVGALIVNVHVNQDFYTSLLGYFLHKP